MYIIMNVMSTLSVHILGVIAIAKGLRTHGRFLVEYSEDELLDFESRV